MSSSAPAARRRSTTPSRADARSRLARTASSPTSPRRSGAAGRGRRRASEFGGARHRRQQRRRLGRAHVRRHGRRRPRRRPRQERLPGAARLAGGAAGAPRARRRRDRDHLVGLGSRVGRRAELQPRQGRRDQPREGDGARSREGPDPRLQRRAGLGALPGRELGPAHAATTPRARRRSSSARSRGAGSARSTRSPTSSRSSSHHARRGSSARASPSTAASRARSDVLRRRWPIRRSNYADGMEVAGRAARRSSSESGSTRSRGSRRSPSARTRPAGAPARGAVRRADAVPARPRPARPLEAVPPAEGQDAGLHRPGGRPLPHADDPHARDDRDLTRRRPRPAAERGSRRGDRPRARHGPHAVRTRRRGRARRGAARRASAGGFRHNEQSHRIARALNLTHEVCDGILTHTGARSPRRSRGKIVRLVDRVAYINHDIDDALRYGLLARGRPARATRSRCSGRPARERIDTLVHDIVETSERRGDIRQSDEIGEAMLSLRAFMFERVYLGPHVEPGARSARATSSRRSSTRSSPNRSACRRATAISPTGSPTISPG